MKTTLHTLTLGAALSILMISCGPGRQFTHADAGNGKIRSIAVLPATIHYTGIGSKKLGEKVLFDMLDQQSVTFQRALHDNLLRYSGRKKKIPGVSFQSIDKTNGLLRAAGLDWRDVSSADPDELASLLGVDAVVKMQVTSNRLISDAASMALGTVKDLLFFSTKTNPGVTSSIPSTTGDLTANATLIHEGKTLWNASYGQPTDWQRGSEEVVYNVTKRMGKGFPY